MRPILFHKPYGVLSQFTSEEGHRTLAEFGLPPRCYPVGRLDQDSEGLLLLVADDGVLVERLLNPRSGHPRTYWVQVERAPDPAMLARLASGVVIQGKKTMPCEVRKMDPPSVSERVPPIRFRVNVPTAWLEMILIEGRNRQVRRMTAAIGHPTLRLIRHAIGGLTLEGLHPGRWREISATELTALRRFLSLS
ncbi:MAG: pseudouridine synthase [Verrucomicrobiia bacterium]